LLIRMSHQIRFGEKDLENVATIVNKNTNSSTEPGTTLGYAVGYLIGKCLFLGEDCTSLIDICSKTVVLNYDIFKKGLHKGFSKSQGLMFDNVYVQNLNERYAEHWNEQSRDICYNAFKLMGTYKEVVKYENEHIDNPINEKMTWFLKGMFPKDDFINKLHLLHLNQVEQFSTKEFGNSPAFASMVQKTVKTKLAEETVKLKKQFEDDLNNIKNEYQVKLAAEVARIQQQAIDNAQQTLAEQAQINQHKRETEATKAVQHKIGRFL
jgi:hypothetical protein